MVRLPLQGEPGEAAVLVDQAALGGATPGKGDGAGVGAEEILHPLPGGHMGVAGEEDLGGASGRGIVGAYRWPWVRKTCRPSQSCTA